MALATLVAALLRQVIGGQVFWSYFHPRLKGYDKKDWIGGICESAGLDFEAFQFFAQSRRVDRK